MNTKIENVTPELKEDIDQQFNKIISEILTTNHDRTAIYNYNNYTFGNTMQSLFPNGVRITTPEDWNKYSTLIMIVAKLSRYCTCLANTGHDHQDSIHDIAVYSIMYEEMLQRYASMREVPIKPNRPVYVPEPGPNMYELADEEFDD